MTKTRRGILSTELKKAMDRRELSRATQTEQLKTDLQNRASFVAPDGDIPITKDGAQRGRVLKTSEIVKRLKRINPALWYEVSLASPEIGGLYAIENRLDPRTNTSPWKRHICGIPAHEVWEFHRPILIEEDVPDPDLGEGRVRTVQVKGQIPGWRAILLRLVQEQLITLPDCEKHFQVSAGRSSQRWQTAIH